VNLREYLESDILDFELNDGVIDECKKLFDKESGLRSYINPFASYLINYTDKIVTMVNIFEENFHEIKAFKLISEKFGFLFDVRLLDFENISPRDNIIQTIKFLVAMEECMKTSKNPHDYSKLINSPKVIEESKRRFEKFLTLKEYNKFSVEKV
jgi:hypothetical protein